MSKIFLIPVLALSIFVFQGCDKDDDLTNPGGNKEVKSAFNVKYPDATRIEWEKKGTYWVADFWENGKEMEAWFDLSGVWHQTETDLLVTMLPEAVMRAFASGDYKDWRIEDVDMFERKDTETFYVLDVENGKQDYDLYYSPDGVLIKAIADHS